MFLFKRNNSREDTEIVLTRTVQLGRDTIVLGSLNISTEEETNYYVEDMLTIEADASLKGQITATRCNIEGKVIGDIVCAEELTIASSAIINGAILAKSVFMESGCTINGKVVLDPTLEVTLLSIKIMEAEAYLENQDAAIVREFNTNIDTPIHNKSAHHNPYIQPTSNITKSNSDHITSPINNNVKPQKKEAVNTETNSDGGTWW